MTSPVATGPATGGFVQAVISFAVSVTSILTSSFALARCVWDEQESAIVISGVDQPGPDQLVADHPPFAPTPG
jgi:hypothetical protein